MAKKQTEKKQPYLQRAANTFGAQLTGRFHHDRNKHPTRYLTDKELDEYKAKPKKPKK